MYLRHFDVRLILQQESIFLPPEKCLHFIYKVYRRNL